MNELFKFSAREATKKISERRTLILFTSLYLAQGLPYGFFMQALPVLLRKSGSSLTVVGASSLLALPWGVKFLWAPLLDRFGLAKIGLRRSWILPSQVLAGLLFLAISGLEPGASLPWVMSAVLCANLLAATQDIATDALAIDTLSFQQRGWAGGIKVGAYRIGMIIGGGVILKFADLLKWNGLMWFIAATLLICTIPALQFNEGAESLLLKRRNIRSYRDALSDYLQFFKLRGSGAWLTIVAVFKMSHYAASEMIRPWLVDQGYTVENIATVLSTAGFLAGFLGAAVGGWLASRTIRRSWLAALGFLQMLGVASYLIPIKTPPAVWKIYLATAADHFTSGVANVFLFTMMMDACRQEHAATEYALQSCLVVISTTLAASLSGVSAEYVGYELHFLASAVLGLSTSTLTWILLKREDVNSLLNGESFAKRDV